MCKSLQEITNEVLAKGYALEDINFNEIEVCVTCDKLLLPDDEAYSSYNEQDVFCSQCSVYCDVCEMYMSENEVHKYEDNVVMCPKCNEMPF